MTSLLFPTSTLQHQACCLPILRLAAADSHLLHQCISTERPARCRCANLGPPPTMTTLQALASHLFPEETEVVAQKTTTCPPVNVDGDRAMPQVEATIWEERNRTKSTCCSASFMGPRRIAGVRRRLRSIEGGQMTGSCGRISDIYIGTSCRGCGGGFWDSRS